MKEICSPAHTDRVFWDLTGPKDNSKADSDGETDWKRSLWRSLDGKVAW